MSRVSSIKVGGEAEFYVLPDSAKEFILILNKIRELKIPFRVVGALSNTLIATDIYRGVLVSTLNMKSVREAEGLLFAECGATLASVMSYAARSGYGGAEQLWLIPGTVGAAIRGNSGAHGIEISDVTESAVVYFADKGNVQMLSREELEFGYRTSAIKQTGDAYVLGVYFELQPSTRTACLVRKRQFLDARRAAQPIELPSLGSVFKKVREMGAGYYIERAGLKGFTVGAAQVSPKHAGFIVNLGDASWTDVLRIIEHVQTCVYAKFGILLEREIEVLN